MSSQHLVSVCIPCYNGEKFIGKTIQSVLNQTFTDFEIIIVDDKSTDSTVSVIQGFTDKRIRLIRNETNLGLGLNWTRTLSQSQGKYVKLLCEDDVLHPECLAQQVSVLEASGNSRVVLAVGNRLVVDERNRVVLKARRTFHTRQVGGPRLIRESVRSGSNLIGEPVAGLFRRDALKRYPFDPSNPYLADLALWAELLREGDAFLDGKCLAAFRISNSSTSARIGFGQAAAFRSFVRALRHDPAYQITNFDLFAGIALSFGWCLFRNGFMNLHSLRGRTEGLRAGSNATQCREPVAGTSALWCA